MMCDKSDSLDGKILPHWPQMLSSFTRGGVVSEEAFLAMIGFLGLADFLLSLSLDLDLAGLFSGTSSSSDNEDSGEGDVLGGGGSFGLSAGLDLREVGVVELPAARRTPGLGDSVSRSCYIGFHSSAYVVKS